MADKAHCLRWIIGELPELEQRQLISAEQKAGLMEYYSGRLAQVRSQKNTSVSKYFGFMLWLIGTLFIAGGLILAVTYNWNMLSRCLRLMLGMLPLFCGTLLGIWTICRKESSQILKESSAILCSAGFAILTAVTSQIYHTGGTLGEFMTLVLALCLALVYVFNSISCATLYILGLLFFGFEIKEGFCAAGFAAFLPYMFYHLTHTSPFRVWMRYLAVLLAISGLIYCGEEGYILLAMLSTATVGLLAGRELYENGEKGFRNPWLVPSFIFLLIILGISSSTAQAFDPDFSTVADELAAYWIYTGVTLLLVVVLYLRRRLDVERFMTGLWLLVTAATLIPHCRQLPEILRISCNIFTVIFGVLLLSRGCTLRQRTAFNGGFLLIAVILVCRFFDDHFGVLLRSLGFIALGLAFIACNIFFAHRKKTAEAATEQ